MEDESDPLVTNVHTHVYYEGNAAMNEILRAPHPEGSFDPFTTGKLNMVPRIFL